jgi:hydrogenase maturation protein HypF
MMQIKYIKLPFKIKNPVLALGTQTQNTVCFARGYLAYLSPPLRDLSSPDDFFKFEKAVKFFLKKNPKVIAYDLHPEYQSSRYALSLPGRYRMIPLQHHHAHIASVMAQGGLKNQKTIGVAFDGTGLGSDNRIWGAEFLVCDYKNFQRKAHLKEIPLLGGEKAILEPWRLAAAWLYQAYKDGFLNLNIDAVKRMDKNKWKVFKGMYRSGFNSPLASSMGRLFDAVGYLVFKKEKIDFQAQLALRLQECACFYKGAGSCGYGFHIVKNKDKYIINPVSMFREIVRDLKKGKPKEKIAYCFHATIARMVRQMCVILRKNQGLNRVVLSGGVFQNNLLLKLVLDLLYKDKFSVVIPQRLSCNDSGISLGQAAIANFSGD